MKRSLMFAAASLLSVSSAEAATVLYDSSATFSAAAPGATVVEDFEDSPLASRNTLLPLYSGPGGEITFLPFDGTPVPNVFIADAGYTNFGAGVNPTTSTILTANGNEGFEGVLASPTTALGFNVYLNDSPFTVEFFNGLTSLGVLTFDDPVVPGSNLGFAGITADAITSFRIAAVNGQNINTGVDNIAIGAVPEPSTWLMMLLGFGAIGGAMRRTRSRTKPALAS